MKERNLILAFACWVALALFAESILADEKKPGEPGKSFANEPQQQDIAK